MIPAPSIPVYVFDGAVFESWWKGMACLRWRFIVIWVTESDMLFGIQLSGLEW